MPPSHCRSLRSSKGPNIARSDPSPSPTSPTSPTSKSMARGREASTDFELKVKTRDMSILAFSPNEDLTLCTMYQIELPQHRGKGFCISTHKKRKYHHACISEALAIMAAASGSSKRTKLTIQAGPLEIDVAEF